MSETTPEAGTVSYSHNANRQLQSETRTFTGLGSNNYTFNYSYNLGGQLTQANYVAPSFSKNVNYAYNGKGALSGIGTNLIGSDPNADDECHQCDDVPGVWGGEQHQLWQQSQSDLELRNGCDETLSDGSGTPGWNG